jgi:cytochrome P450
MNAPPLKRRYPGEFLFKISRDAPRTLTQLAAQGPIVGLRLGSFQLLFISQPELIHQVLVTQAADFTKGRGERALRRLLGQGLLTSDGPLHKAQRRLLQPVFQAQKVGAFSTEITHRTDYLLRQWPRQGVIDASPEMSRLTMQIVGECLFGTNLEQDVQEVRQALQQGMNLFRLASMPFTPWLEKLYPPLRSRLQQSRQRLDAVLVRMIDSHRSCPQADLLGRMIESDMSPELLRDESMTLFLAGHETTAHALTFALYLLSRHPQEQHRLRQELALVSGSGTLEMEHVPRLTGLKNSLLETMRLYPPAWAMGRQALRATTLGGYQVPPGCNVLMSQYVMHRRPDVFPDPDQFRPERWQEKPRHCLPKGSYFPFGAGPRVCIGEHFAWLEMMLGLGTILKHYRLLPCPVENPRLRTRVTLAPGQPLWIPVQRID